MTEQERIDRQTLVKRAAAAAGAMYVAPALAPSAAAKVDRRPRKCRSGRTCDTSRDCRNRGNEPCVCCPQGTDRAFTCQATQADCDTPCPDCSGSSKPCDQLFTCGNSGNGACFLIAGTAGVQHGCIDLHQGFCASYPPCDKETGEGCPPGYCCMDTCCETGICGYPASLPGKTARHGSGDSGARPYR